ncbi:MAG: TrkH family potassium uptake protein [Methanobacteriaceae archaeon]|jgi:trk system potassium uptake protein TrkH|nr:MAG: cation transporter [Methanobacterium sp. BRmetb2]MCC7558219.1 TrkH family potassium uptake protein [Methanobacteriaceae archaeon]
MHAAFRLNRRELYSIFHYTGWVLILLGIALILPIIVALIYNEGNYILPFLISSAISLVIGAILFKLFENKKEISLKSAMIFSTGIWLLVSALGALPYFLSGELSLLDSYFEAMSGFTTTGFSMIPNIDTIGYSLNFWRSFTQWLGGIGIIVLLLTVLSSPSVNIMRMYIAEAREERILPSIRHTTRIIFYIYTSFTIFGFILFLTAGMPVYDSVFHAFTTLSTGGFGMHNTSLGYYNSFWIEIVAIIIMMIGATNYALHYTVLKGNWKEYFKDIETKLLYILLLISTALITFMLLKNHSYGDNIFLTLRYSFFQAVSAITTTGLQTAAVKDVLTKWVGLGTFLLTLLMLIGAGSCSTGGGIKWLRTAVSIKNVWWQIKDYLLPSKAVTVRKIHHVRDIKVSDTLLRSIGIFIFVYLAIYISSVIVVMMFYQDIAMVIFEVASALGNVGLSSGLLTPSSPAAVKIVFIIDFWIGRLEVWSVLLFVSIILRNLFRR